MFRDHQGRYTNWAPFINVYWQRFWPSSSVYIITVKLDPISWLFNHCSNQICSLCVPWQNANCRIQLLYPILECVVNSTQFTLNVQRVRPSGSERAVDWQKARLYNYILVRRKKNLRKSNFLINASAELYSREWADPVAKKGYNRHTGQRCRYV